MAQDRSLQEAPAPIKAALIKKSSYDIATLIEIVVTKKPQPACAMNVLIEIGIQRPSSAITVLMKIALIISYAITTLIEIVITNKPQAAWAINVLIEIGIQRPSSSITVLM